MPAALAVDATGASTVTACFHPNIESGSGQLISRGRSDIYVAKNETNGDTYGRTASEARKTTERWR